MTSAAPQPKTDALCSHPAVRVLDYDDEDCCWLVSCPSCGDHLRYRQGELRSHRTRSSSQVLRPLMSVADEGAESARYPRV